MTRERAVVRILAMAVDEMAGKPSTPPALTRALKAGGFARRTFHRAVEFRRRALEERYGSQRDGKAALWPDLNAAARFVVMERALELARGAPVHPDVQRRLNREKRRRSLSPAERERYDQRRPIRDRGRKR